MTAGTITTDRAARLAAIRDHQAHMRLNLVRKYGVDFGDVDRGDTGFLLSEIDRLTTELDTTRAVLRDLMMTALQNGGDNEELLAACRRAFGYLDDRTCVDCGGRDDLRHVPAGLAGTGPTLTLCASCRAERKRVRQNGGAE